MKVSFNEMAMPFFFSCIILSFISSIMGFFNVFFSFFMANFFLSFAMFFIYIFREPSVHPLGGISSVVSPCDGKIDYIKVENGLTAITIRCNLLDKFVKYSPIDGEIINLIFFSREHSQFGGGIEIEICESDGFKVTIVFFSNHWISSGYKVKSFVSVGQRVHKGDPLTFIPFFCIVKVIIPGASNIMAKNGNILHAGFSHLVIKGLE